MYFDTIFLMFLEDDVLQTVKNTVPDYCILDLNKAIVIDNCYSSKTVKNESPNIRKINKELLMI